MTDLHVGQHVEAKDLKLPEGVVLLDEPDRVIASLSHARLETAETGEGGTAEPEVIKRPKAEA